MVESEDIATFPSERRRKLIGSRVGFHMISHLSQFGVVNREELVLHSARGVIDLSLRWQLADGRVDHLTRLS